MEPHLIYHETRPVRPELMLTLLSYFNLPVKVLLHIEQFLSLEDIFELIRLSEPWIEPTLPWEDL